MSHRNVFFTLLGVLVLSAFSVSSSAQTEEVGVAQAEEPAQEEPAQEESPTPPRRPSTAPT